MRMYAQVGVCMDAYFSVCASRKKIVIFEGKENYWLLMTVLLQWRQILAMKYIVNHSDVKEILKLHDE